MKEFLTCIFLIALAGCMKSPSLLAPGEVMDPASGYVYRPRQVEIPTKPGCSDEGSECLDSWIVYHGKMCDSKNLEAADCFEFARLREKRGDLSGLVLQSYQRACDAEDNRGCVAIKRIQGPNYDPHCEDIADIPYPWTIIQKINGHSYELVRRDGARMILKTRRASFSRTGTPIGVKAKNVFKSIKLPSVNGFSQSYGVLEECGIVPLPKKGIYPPGVSVRSWLKEDF